MSHGGRPASAPMPVVEVAANDRVLGTVTVTADLQPYTFALPADLVAAAAAERRAGPVAIARADLESAGAPRRQRQPRSRRPRDARRGAVTARVLRALTGLAAHMTAAIAVIGATLIAAYLAAMVVFAKPEGRVVFGDATHHFVQLRSLVFDRDLHFRNEYVRMYSLRGGERRQRVRLHRPDAHRVCPQLHADRTGAALGASLSARRGLPTGCWRDRTGLAAGRLRPRAANDAWSHRCARGDARRVDQLPVGAPVHRRRQRGVGDAGVWLGSHALYYSLVSPAYSHAASMFASSLFFSRGSRRATGERSSGSRSGARWPGYAR